MIKLHSLLVCWKYFNLTYFLQVSFMWYVDWLWFHNILFFQHKNNSRLDEQILSFIFPSVFPVFFSEITLPNFYIRVCYTFFSKTLFLSEKENSIQSLLLILIGEFDTLIQYTEYIKNIWSIMILIIFIKVYLKKMS